ncbi:DUF6262 family protein [Streptomyces sp. NPDC087525]|uniref:DUF6262 family protein n=1 Tax=Streptomyces sp. NPDC087525 TaxID=3365793 RepID=UPI0037FC9830
MNTATVPRTAAALAARHRKTEAALERVHQAITRLRREKAQINAAAVARRADVSRTFLYDNTEARAVVAAAMAQAGERRSRTLAEQDDEREATWRERALNAEEALKATHTEILPSAPGSANSSARYATWKTNGPRKPSSGSPPRTPPSNSASASSPPTTAPWTNGSRSPAPTCASRTAAWPTLKHRSQLCLDDSRRPRPPHPSVGRPRAQSLLPRFGCGSATDVSQDAPWLPQSSAATKSMICPVERSMTTNSWNWSCTRPQS